MSRDISLRYLATSHQQALIDLEASEVIGAGRYERTDTRTTHRDRSRARVLSTKAGDVELAIPRLRHGSFRPRRCWSRAGGWTGRCGR
jgi:transposase-like protein